MPKTPFELACEYMGDILECPADQMSCNRKEIEVDLDCEHFCGDDKLENCGECWKLYFEKEADKEATLDAT